jgi:hypothetical protein
MHFTTIMLQYPFAGQCFSYVTYLTNFIIHGVFLFAINRMYIRPRSFALLSNQQEVEPLPSNRCHRMSSNIKNEELIFSLALLEKM